MQGLKFKRFPYLLTMQLKRFDFDYSTMHRMKLNDCMTFPNVLDLNAFVDPAEMVSREVWWVWCGVLPCYCGCYPVVVCLAAVRRDRPRA